MLHWPTTTKQRRACPLLPSLPLHPPCDQVACKPPAARPPAPQTGSSTLSLNTVTGCALICVPVLGRRRGGDYLDVCQPAWLITGDTACIRARLLTLRLLTLRHRVDEGLCHKLAAVRGAVKQAVAAAQPDLQVSAQGSITGPISPDAAQACLRYLLPDSQVSATCRLLMELGGALCGAALGQRGSPAGAHMTRPALTRHLLAPGRTCTSNASGQHCKYTGHRPVGADSATTCHTCSVTSPCRQGLCAQQLQGSRPECGQCRGLSVQLGVSSTLLRTAAVRQLRGHLCAPLPRCGALWHQSCSCKE